MNHSILSYFSATFVEKFDTFWMKVMSTAISVDNSTTASPTVTTPTVSTSETTTSVAANINSIGEIVPAS